MCGRATVGVLAVLAGCDQLFLLQHIDPPPREAGIDAVGDTVTSDIPIPPGGAFDDVATGGAHTCALRGGVVRCWGLGIYGQTGHGGTVNYGDNEPASAAPDVSAGPDISTLTAGMNHTCALRSTGAVLCWGQGLYGRLGYASENPIGDSETPASAGAVNVGGAVTRLDAGELHTCAVLGNGAVRCWGVATNGRLGYANGESIGDTEPPTNAGDINVGIGARQVSAGGDHTCVLTIDNLVRCWGSNQLGQLGYPSIGDVGDNEQPATVGDVNVGGTVEQIATGQSHTCARMTSGGVRCWGQGSFGQLGYGNDNNVGDTETPSSVGDVSIGGTAIDISAGAYHTCVVRQDKTVVCWGNNEDGRLGYGHTTTIGDTVVPSTAGPVPVGAPVVRVFAGDHHTCALLESGQIRCWGDADAGRLGYGNINDVGDNEPASAAGDVPVF